jgi:hypothetical protein
LPTPEKRFTQRRGGNEKWTKRRGSRKDAKPDRKGAEKEILVIKGRKERRGSRKGAKGAKGRKKEGGVAKKSKEIYRNK